MKLLDVELPSELHPKEIIRNIIIKANLHILVIIQKKNKIHNNYLKCFNFHIIKYAKDVIRYSKGQDVVAACGQLGESNLT